MSKPPKILYIDDEVELVILAEAFFEDEMLPIDTSTNFQDALEKIKHNSYDFIISDARMPSGSGKEIIKIAKEELGFNGFFILVTGYVDTVEELDNHPFDLILYKPLRFQDLVDIVRNNFQKNSKSTGQ